MPSSELYRRPDIYDIAFGWDEITREITVLRQCFTHAATEPATLLEPACGTGRFLRKFPAAGLRVTGYDASPAMVAFARESLLRAGLAGRAVAVEADMRTARFDRRFDSAFNAINSIGYLLSDEDFLAHLTVTAEALRPGAVYAIQLGCAADDPAAKPAEEWTCERDGLRVRTRWGHAGDDRRRRLIFEACRITVSGPQGEEVIEERHTLRRWTYADLTDLIRRNGRFRLTAIYTDSGAPVAPDTLISFRHGNLYYVLYRS